MISMFIPHFTCFILAQLGKRISPVSNKSRLGMLLSSRVLSSQLQGPRIHHQHMYTHTHTHTHTHKMGGRHFVASCQNGLLLGRVVAQG
jgi:hypothetical protein